MGSRFDSGQIYIGYVIDDGAMYGYAKVQVWIPALNGSYSLGTFKGVGKNLGNDFGVEELYALRTSEGDSWYNVTTTLDSGGNTIFDEATGKSTTQRNVRDYNKLDVITNYTYSSSCFGKKFKWKNADPANNLLQQGMLIGENGTEYDTSDGMPYGTFGNLTVGTKVIVVKANNGTRGIVIAKYPWADEMSAVLASSAANS